MHTGSYNTSQTIFQVALHDLEVQDGGKFERITSDQY